jgi:hypothetical protein
MTPLLALLFLAAPTPKAAPGLWAGYEVVEGQRTVPVLGTIPTRRRAWFLARWRPDAGDAGRMILERQPCGVAFDKAKGVQVSLPQTFVRQRPTETVRFNRDAAGGFRGGQWQTGWGPEDADGDGHPGVSVQVDAPLCGGALYISSSSRNQAVAHRKGAALLGRIRTEVRQRVLGASGACLRATASDTVERKAGWFRLVPAPDDATCDSWSHARWPAR